MVYARGLGPRGVTRGGSSPLSSILHRDLAPRPPFFEIKSPTVRSEIFVALAWTSALALSAFAHRFVELVERLLGVAFAPALVLEADHPLAGDFPGQHGPFVAFGFVDPERAELVIGCVCHILRTYELAKKETPLQGRRYVDLLNCKNSLVDCKMFVKSFFDKG